MAWGAISEFAASRNVRRASPEAAVDFAALSFWAWTRRKNSKSERIHFAKRNERFVTPKPGWVGNVTGDLKMGLFG